MTTDPFTTAAQDEAERRWPHHPHQPETHVLSFGKRIGFDLGASWARHQLAAQEQFAREIPESEGRHIASPELPATTATTTTRPPRRPRDR